MDLNKLDYWIDEWPVSELESRFYHGDESPIELQNKIAKQTGVKSLRVQGYQLAHLFIGAET